MGCKRNKKQKNDKNGKRREAGGQVEKYWYLGNLLQATERCKLKIKPRIAMGEKCCSSMNLEKKGDWWNAGYTNEKH